VDDHPALQPGVTSDQLFLVLKEYDYLQSAIDKIDGLRFQIRNWATAAAGALFTVSLSAKVPLAALAGFVTSVFFLFLELVYTQLVDGVVHRSNYLDELINAWRRTGKVPDDYIFGMKQAFLDDFSFRRIPATISIRKRTNVIAFYIGLLAVTAAAGLVVVFQ
jgi:hypothetical protein